MVVADSWILPPIPLRAPLSAFPTSSSGVPYLPDGYCDAEPPAKAMPAWLRTLLFVACYLLLQTLYAGAAGTAVEKIFLQDLGSKPAAQLIGVLAPSLDVRAEGTKVTAPGGGINIKNGCEGTDIYFLLVAAFTAVSLPLAARLRGLAIGFAVAFTLNQARITVLFFAFRADKSLFDMLHTSAAPVVLVVALALYFYAYLHHARSNAALDA